MKIKSMTAVFGKLTGQRLELAPGFNLIEAPNEGGKSTWSAFLRAMLYGVNTKERDRQGYIAEKNRYQPWGGGPMEGSVELIWQGRSITLRRSAKGSTPFGQFEAVYTDTQEPVPGLTGANAGEVLTGVPREVFERSAFVGQGGAAIDGAPALEARIAALASSGEEDVSYSQVERRLRDWLNRRKHNKTGLIPRLEGELAEIDAALARQAKAFRLSQEAKREIDRLQAEHRLLEAERDAHLARAMEQRRERWEAAQAALAQAQAALRDGIFAACRICARLGMTGERLRGLTGKLPRFAICRREVPLRRDGEEVLARLLRELPGARAAGEGLRLRQGEGWLTLSLRASPAVLRVVGEARTAELARELCDFCARKAEEAARPGPEK